MKRFSLTLMALALTLTLASASEAQTKNKSKALKGSCSVFVDVNGKRQFVCPETVTLNGVRYTDAAIAETEKDAREIAKSRATAQSGTKLDLTGQKFSFVGAKSLDAFQRLISDKIIAAGGTVSIGKTDGTPIEVTGHCSGGLCSVMVRVDGGTEIGRDPSAAQAALAAFREAFKPQQQMAAAR